MSTAIPLEQQIAEVRREIALRQHVYPKFVTKGTLSQAQADKQQRAMIAVLATLQGIAASQAALAFEQPKVP